MLAFAPNALSQVNQRDCKSPALQSGSSTPIPELQPKQGQHQTDYYPNDSRETRIGPVDVERHP
jgi:hypothetical protein